MSFIEQIKKNMLSDQVKIDRALKGLDPEYHQFIVIIEQGAVVSQKELTIGSDLKELGCYAYRGKTYQTRRAPYMAVDGRIVMMRDEHRKSEAKFAFSQDIDWENKVLTVYWQSDLYGKTVGTSKIGFDGRGADATNPVENAQTSAVGRALAQAGYGLFGTGSIASAEEVELAIKEQEEAEEAEKSKETEKAIPINRKEKASPPAEKRKKASAPAPETAPEPTPPPVKEEIVTGPITTPQYSPEQVRRLIAIKSDMGITDNVKLDKYVSEFGKEINVPGLSKHTQLVGDLLKQFCDFMEENHKEAS